MFKFDEKYCLETFKTLLAIDSVTGEYEEIQKGVAKILKKEGYTCKFYPDPLIQLN